MYYTSTLLDYGIWKNGKPVQNKLKYSESTSSEKMTCRKKILNHPDLKRIHCLECYGGVGNLSKHYTGFKTHTILEKEPDQIPDLQKFQATVHNVDNMKFDYSKLTPVPDFVDFDSYSQPFPLIEKYLAEQKPPKFLALTDGAFLNMSLHTTTVETRYKWLEHMKYPVPEFSRPPSFQQIIKESTKLHMQDILEKHGCKMELLSLLNRKEIVYMAVKI